MDVMRPSGPCTETMSGDVSASSFERASAARRRVSAWSRSAWRRASSSLARRSLRIAWRLRKARATPANSSHSETRRFWPSLKIAAMATIEVSTPQAAIARRQRYRPGLSEGITPVIGAPQGGMSGRSCFLQLRRRALRRDRAQLDARAELQPGAVHEPRQHVDAPAELLRSLRSRAHPQVQRWRGAEQPPQPREPVVQQRRAERAVVLEARGGPAWGEHQLERHL